MEPSELPTGEKQSPKRQVQIQGYRPPPLSVHKDSRKIRKPPKPPAHQNPPQAAACNLRQQPVVIYAVSPKVVHATASEFMSVVQRLTGISSGVFSDGEISPAARLAATEKASPRVPREGHSLFDGVKEDQMMEFVKDEVGATESNQVTEYVPAGILSPAPEKMPWMAAGMFSPASDPSYLMSPFFLSNNSFVTSPMFQTNSFLVSPMFSPTNIYGQLFNF